MLKKYRVGFEAWAAVLFVLIMLPNVIWYALPERPFSLLSIQNPLPAVDAVSSTARVLMVACLCFLKNRDIQPLRLGPLILACALCVLAYYVMWALYFAGVTPALAVCGLCVFPCAAFVLFSIGRKNFPALAFALVFTVCHALCTGASLRLAWNYNL